MKSVRRKEKKENLNKKKKYKRRLKMAENNKPFIRSINNRQISFVRFINGTNTTVELYWVDYNGRATWYGCLSPGSYKDIDTFVTHPWIFVDERTKERYMVNHKDVFYPEPWLKKCFNGTELCSLDITNRKKAIIKEPIDTLVELSARVIMECLNSKEQVLDLDIPRSLQAKLVSIMINESIIEKDS